MTTQEATAVVRTRSVLFARTRIPDMSRWYECQSVKVQPPDATNRAGRVRLSYDGQHLDEFVVISVPGGERTTARWRLSLSSCVGMTCGRKDGKPRIRRRALCDSERKRKKANNAPRSEIFHIAREQLLSFSPEECAPHWLIARFK